VGVGALAIPGIGPFVAAGALAAALGGAAIGAGVGAITGALVGMGIPKHEADWYEQEVRSGGTLVTVRANGRYGEAQDLLVRHGAYNVATRDAERIGYGVAGDSPTDSASTGADGARQGAAAGGATAMATEQPPAPPGTGAAASGAQDRVTPLAAAFDRDTASDGPDRPAAEMPETRPGGAGETHRNAWDYPEYWLLALLAVAAAAGLAGLAWWLARRRRRTWRDRVSDVTREAAEALTQRTSHLVEVVADLTEVVAELVRERAAQAGQAAEEVAEQAAERASKAGRAARRAGRST
jgi:hypothetical protein